MTEGLGPTKGPLGLSSVLLPRTGLGKGGVRTSFWEEEGDVKRYSPQTPVNVQRVPQDPRGYQVDQVPGGPSFSSGLVWGLVGNGRMGSREEVQDGDGRGGTEGPVKHSRW